MSSCWCYCKSLLMKNVTWTRYNGRQLLHVDGHWRCHRLIDILDSWTQTFQEKCIPDAASSAEHIIAHVKGLKTFHNVHTMSITLNKEEVGTVNQLCELRLKRMPVQYIIKEWDFCNLTLKMRPPVLIPRPETEELVEHCKTSLEMLNISEGRELIFLEIGCGSGAISLALLHKFKKLRAVALDISTDACQLTLENAISVGVADRLQVVEGDIKNESVLTELKASGPFSLLVSNPPYIRSNDLSILPPEVRLFEDHVALFAGEDGLHLINFILKNASELVLPHCDIWLEVAQDHPTIIHQLTDSRTFPTLRYLKTVKDMFERQRFVHLQVST